MAEIIQETSKTETKERPTLSSQDKMFRIGGSTIGGMAVGGALGSGIGPVGTVIGAAVGSALGLVVSVNDAMKVSDVVKAVVVKGDKKQ